MEIIRSATAWSSFAAVPMTKLHKTCYCRHFQLSRLRDILFNVLAYSFSSTVACIDAMTMGPSGDHCPQLLTWGTIRLLVPNFWHLSVANMAL